MFTIFKGKSRNPKEDLDDLLEGYEIPSFPTAVMKVLQMLRDPDVEISLIAEELQVDPGMTVRVLQMVNSAAYGSAQKVTDVAHAVTLVGRSPLEAMVISVAVKDIMPGRQQSGFDLDRFWLSSARRASAARLLSHHLHPATSSEAFTSGLLQDIAVPVLADLKGDAYCEIYQRWQNEDDLRLEDLLNDLIEEAFNEAQLFYELMH